MVLAATLVGLAGVGLLGTLGPMGPAAATAPVADVGEARPPAAGPEPRAPVVLVGVTGLRWDDVQTLSTPALWDLSRVGSLGLVAARSVSAVACPADGWLGVSAGARLADADSPDGTCRTLLTPGDDGVVPGWADYVAAAEQQPYAALPGTLGETLAAAGVPVTAIGPGAAVALAGPDGVVVGPALHRPGTGRELGAAVREALRSSALVVVDAGTVRDAGNATRGRASAAPVDPGEDAADLPEEDGTRDPSGVDVIVEPTRAEQVRAIDERLDAIARATRTADATVIVVSLADSGRPRLQLIAATGPAPDGGTYDRSLLTSGSTQQVGVVQATDVSATVLALLGLDPLPASVGAPVRPVAGPASATDRVDRLLDIATEARQVVRLSGSYLTRLVLAQALLFVAAALLLTARRPTERPGVRRGLRALQVTALALGAAPVASFLTGLLPWWRTSPTLAFWGSVLGWMALITVAALRGPWRHQLLGPAGLVAGVTVLVILADAATGSTLVIDSPMGAHRIQAARFYGMSNQAFALLAAGSLMLATAVAQALIERGRRGLATAAVVAIGVVVTVMNGTPGLGSDFGGPPAIILGFTVLALVVSGRRVRWRTLALVVLVAAVIVVGFSWLDWLRPPGDRTHLGRFFATVIDGGLWEVVARKLGVHLRVLTYWRYLVLALGGSLITALVLLGPSPWRRGARAAAPLSGLGRAVPLLGAGIGAIGVSLGVGFLINDSGIIVPATGIALAVPCLIAAAARLQLARDTDVARPLPDAEVSPRPLPDAARG